MAMSSIRNRILLHFCLLAVAPVGLLGFLVSQRVEEVLEERVSREMRLEVVTAAETVETYLQGVRRDLLSLSRFLRRRLPISEEEVGRRAFEQEFYQAIRAEGSYHQIRFIGADGWEKLRINNINGQLLPVPSEKLQYKGDRYYFTETMTLEQDEVYLSPLDFNVEHGKIEEPHRLVTRMATPVTDGKGRIQGIVIINIFGIDLLKMLQAVPPVSESRIFLAGEKDYVERLPGEKSAAIEFGELEKLRDLLSVPLAELRAFDTPQVRTDRSPLLATAPIFASTSKWLLVKTFPRSLIDEDVEKIRRTIGLVAGVLLLIAAALATGFASSLVRPISRLCRFAEEISSGDYSSRTPNSRRDEFGHLADSLNRMAAELDSSHRKLTHWNRSLQQEVSVRTQELRASEEKYRLIFTAESDAILIIDADTRRIEEANDAACRLYGYQRGEMIGIDTLTLSAEPEKSMQRAAEIFAGRRTHIELATHRRKDGSTFPASISAGVFDWQGRRMLVGIVRDISERRRLENLREEMLAGISHEMRTPLTSVIGYLELLVENEFEPSETQEYLGICLQEAERLHRLIENLLSMQRLRSGEMLKLEPVDILALLRQEAAAFEASHEGTRLQLRCEEDMAAIVADPDMLHLALSNLLDNAQRYSPAHAEVVLGVSRERDDIVFMVRDQGPGIPDDLQKEIFDRFFRIDSRDGRRLGGTGLGLPLVKEVARAHGGSVRVESREGEGSSFYLIIPAPEAS